LINYFSDFRYVDPFRRYSRSTSKVVRNRAEFWTVFWPAKLRSAEGSRRLRVGKRKKRNITGKTEPSQLSVASIHIFEGANFFPHRDGDEASAQRAKARGPKGRERRWGSWEGERAPFSQLGDLGSAVSSPSGAPAEPRKI